MGNSLSSPQQWVELYADDLYAYAFKTIPDPHQAENLIQETLLAALKSKDSFVAFVQRGITLRVS